MKLQKIESEYELDGTKKVPAKKRIIVKNKLSSQNARLNHRD